MAAPLFRFVQITDVHVGQQDNLPEHERLKAAVALINSLGPAFVIDTGDVATRPVHEATEANLAELDQYKRHVAPLTMPLYVVPGNHDVGYFRPGERTWKAGRPWGDYGALVRAFKQRIGPLDQSFTHGGFRFVLVNNNPPASREPGYLSPAQREWLTAELARGETAFLFAHVEVLDGGCGEPRGESGEFIAALCRRYAVPLCTYGHKHEQHLVDRDGTLYLMAPDLKVPGHQAILEYVMFDHRFEITRHDVFSREHTVLCERPLTRSRPGRRCSPQAS